MVGELSDPEKDFNEFTHTSERKVTCVIKFEDDDCYKLIPYIKDKAGNNAENIEDRDTWINYGEEYYLYRPELFKRRFEIPIQT